MSQAMNSAMTGMSAGQQQITVVSDNIANLNTTAYKESQMNFQDIFYQTKSSGTQGTGSRGGTNPLQIGFGVISSSITKNFEPSTINTTGRSTDMALLGNGFFTVMDEAGRIFLTRDGGFSFDGNGYLCSSNGMRVLGTNYSIAHGSSKTPVKVPENIQAETKPRSAADLANRGVRSLNGTVLHSISEGTFSIDATINNAKQRVEITIPDVTNMTMQGLVDSINADLDPADTGVKCSLIDGAISFTLEDNSAGDKATALEFISGTSSFVQATGISSNEPKGDPKHYDSDILDYTVEVNPVTNIIKADTKRSVTFSEQGTLEVTYSSGDKISLSTDNTDGTLRFQYVTSGGVRITGDDCAVDPNLMVPANLQVQTVSVANPEGLIASGSNMYTVGPNSGTAVYSMGSSNGVGALRTGGLESSNVDLSRQFSNMILAQRAIEANSRVFDTANSVLQTLVYLGRG